MELKLITTADAARALGIHPDTLLRRARKDYAFPQPRTVSAPDAKRPEYRWDLEELARWASKNK